MLSEPHHSFTRSPMDAISEKDCYSILEKRLRTKSFDVVSFVVQPFSEILGFHGSHAMLKIQAKINNEDKEYSFFVKMATKSQLVFDEYFGPMRFFSKEHILMTRVIEDLQAQLSKKLTAKCYLSKLNKAIVLENLGEAGFEVIREKRLDLAHAKIAVETFADFHAASFILASKGVDLDEKYPEIMYESFFVSFKDTERYLLRSSHLGSRKLAGKLCSQSSNVLDQVLAKLTKRSEELCKPSKKFKNVMCQGDPWGNNVMYRYQSGVPKEGILVDFQTSRYAPPALELMQFLYIGTPKSFRVEHRETLSEAYYSRLVRTLGAAGLDPADWLPKEEFAESCSAYEEFGVAAQLFYAYLTRIPGQYLAGAVQDERVFLEMMIGSDATIPTEALQDEEYKRSMMDALDDVMEFYNAK